MSKLLCCVPNNGCIEIEWEKKKECSTHLMIVNIQDSAVPGEENLHQIPMHLLK